MGDDSAPHAVGYGPSNTGGGQTGYLIAGIGASADGLTALHRFFNQVTADSGLAYIVILHLSPQHASSLAAVLQAIARIPVTEVTGTVKIRPNHVYVNPPTEQMVVEDGCLRLVEFNPLKGGHTSIDTFLRSLAEAYQKDAVAVILSGTGSDGTPGLRRIKGKAGFVTAQDPLEAAYDSMLRSVIATGLVDLILPPLRYRPGF